MSFQLQKKIKNNEDVVCGGDTEFGGESNNPTWKVYKDGVVQNSIPDVVLTMQTAYNIYELYK